MNPYESGKLLSEYLLFHYGGQETLGDLPGPRSALGFAARSVSELMDYSKPSGAALDVGCAVGRSSFELARHSKIVVGVDFSSSFISAAKTLRDQGRMTAEYVVEGNITTEFLATVPEDIDRNRTQFEVGDAMNLRADIGSFDVVLAANLICRLSEPVRFLNRLPGLVKPGGQLLLTTPFSWLEEFTPLSNWLGGREGKRSFDALQEILTPHFELKHAIDFPFLIREHARKFQYGIAHGTRWLRR